MWVCSGSNDSNNNYTIAVSKLGKETSVCSWKICGVFLFSCLLLLVFFIGLLVLSHPFSIICVYGLKKTQGGKFKSVYRKRVREQEVAGRGYTFGV